LIGGGKEISKNKVGLLGFQLFLLVLSLFSGAVSFSLQLLWIRAARRNVDGGRSDETPVIF